MDTIREKQNPAPANIDESISGFPDDVKGLLEKIRRTIKNGALDAIETIKYGMPTYVLYGNLISFAIYKNHIGLYPAPTGSKEFNEALSVYRSEKSTVRFPLDKPIPYDLITEIVKLRILDNLKRVEDKK